MKRVFLIFIIFLGIQTLVFSQKKQKDSDFRFWEDSLIRLREQSICAPTESERLALNDEFMTLLETVINEPNSISFKWDSTKNFSVITSPDKLVRFYTWCILKDNHTAINFGFLQVYISNRHKYVIYPLNDTRQNIDYPDSYLGSFNSWYGAIYYDIIPLTVSLKSGKRTYYTLLGLNANNVFSNQKVIDIFYLKNNTTPVFGAKVFKDFPKGKVTRVIFEYNKNASLALTYEPSSYQVKTDKRDPQTRKFIYQTIKDNLIIFEELIPLDEFMPPSPAFTVPESSLYQGFVQHEGKWAFLEKVSVPNLNRDFIIPKTTPKNFYNPN